LLAFVHLVYTVAFALRSRGDAGDVEPEGIAKAPQKVKQTAKNATDFLKNMASKRDSKSTAATTEV